MKITVQGCFEHELFVGGLYIIPYIIPVVGNGQTFAQVAELDVRMIHSKTHHRIICTVWRWP